MSARPLRALVVLPLLLAACDGSIDAAADEPEAPGAVRRRDPTRVRVEPVVVRPMVSTLETTTNLESERRVAILPRAAGEVVAVLAEEGDVVAPGDVLAKLDDRDEAVALREAEVALAESEQAVERARVAIREAEARIRGNLLAYENAKAVYERNEGKGLISAQEVDALRLDRDTAESEWQQAKLALETATIDLSTAETNLEKARLAEERARLALDDTEVRAPFAGTVAQRAVRVGQQLATTTEAFVLVDLDDLRAEFYRPQRELAVFARGARDDAGGDGLGVTLTAESHPGLEFDARILRVSPDIDPESGSFRVTVDVAPEQHGVRLLPGMLVRLAVETERRDDALVVSKRALRREGETTVVFVVRDAVARRVLVDEGFSDDDSVEVRPREEGALQAGEEVVVVGNRDLEDGDALQVTNPDEEPRTGDGASDAPATDDAGDVDEVEAAPATDDGDRAPDTGDDTTTRDGEDA